MHKRLKELRKELKLTLAEMASRLELSQSSVAQYECEVRKPSKSVLQRICTQFNVNRTWLETGAGDMFQPPKEPAVSASESLKTAFFYVFDSLPMEQQAVFKEIALDVLKRSISSPETAQRGTGANAESGTGTITPNVEQAQTPKAEQGQ